MTKNNSFENPIGSVAPLQNVAALVALVQRVVDRGHGLPGMACFYGFSGFGKTSACIYASNKFNAFTVQMKSVWTQRKLCEAILKEMAIAPKGTVSDMIDQIAEVLARTGCPLLIDEADHLVSRNMIELARDIYESSASPVILIGEEQLPQKLQRWERVHGRMLDWVAAQPGQLQDVKLLAPIYCASASIDDALAKHLLTQSHGSLRRIAVNLERIDEFARGHGLKRVTAVEWGSRGFFTGEAPAPRRGVA